MISFEKKLARAKELLAECCDIAGILEILEWDRCTYMPKGSCAGRASQIASLQAIEHRLATAPELQKLSAFLSEHASALDPDSDDFKLIQKLGRMIAKQRAVPEKFVREKAEATALAGDAWERARLQNDYSVYEPALRKVIDFDLEYSTFFPEAKHPLDPHLDNFDEGFTAADADSLFAGLEPAQKAILRKALPARAPRGLFAGLDFPDGKQLEFTRETVTAMGFDWKIGRQDLTIHPFTATLGPRDVRITTKPVPGAPFSALFSSIHECGHALYEQGMSDGIAGTLLSLTIPLSLHESQSRLWENMVGRSSHFWKHFYPRAATLVHGLDRIPFDEFLAEINSVECSPIRTEADELTYNLHIILRYRLEKGLMEGRFGTKDLNGRWNAMMKELLGVDVKDDLHGILQDIHWSCGEFGYFPTYACGNIIAAEVWKKALEEKPEIPSALETGDCSVLRNWLKEEIHRFGGKYTTKELLKKITGQAALDPKPYLDYLSVKYTGEHHA